MKLDQEHRAVSVHYQNRIKSYKPDVLSPWHCRRYVATLNIADSANTRCALIQKALQPRVVYGAHCAVYTLRATKYGQYLRVKANSASWKSSKNETGRFIL